MAFRNVNLMACREVHDYPQTTCRKVEQGWRGATGRNKSKNVDQEGNKQRATQIQRQIAHGRCSHGSCKKYRLQVWR